MKKLDVEKKENIMKKKFSKNLRYFVKIIPHMPYKVQSDKFRFSGNTSIMANKLPSTGLERFLRRIKSPLTRNSAKYIAR